MTMKLNLNELKIKLPKLTKSKPKKQYFIQGGPYFSKVVEMTDEFMEGF